MANSLVSFENVSPHSIGLQTALGCTHTHTATLHGLEIAASRRNSELQRSVMHASLPYREIGLTPWLQWLSDLRCLNDGSSWILL